MPPPAFEGQHRPRRNDERGRSRENMDDEEDAKEVVHIGGVPRSDSFGEAELLYLPEIYLTDSEEVKKIYQPLRAPRDA